MPRCVVVCLLRLGPRCVCMCVCHDCACMSCKARDSETEAAASHVVHAHGRDGAHTFCDATTLTYTMCSRVPYVLSRATMQRSRSVHFRPGQKEVIVPGKHLFSFRSKLSPRTFFFVLTELQRKYINVVLEMRKLRRTRGFFT